jgi:hypothetical protein
MRICEWEFEIKYCSIIWAVTPNWIDVLVWAEKVIALWRPDGY